MTTPAVTRARIIDIALRDLEKIYLRYNAGRNYKVNLPGHSVERIQIISFLSIATANALIIVVLVNTFHTLPLAFKNTVRRNIETPNMSNYVELINDETGYSCVWNATP